VAAIPWSFAMVCAEMTSTRSDIRGAAPSGCAVTQAVRAPADPAMPRRPFHRREAARPRADEKEVAGAHPRTAHVTDHMASRPR
jgi:hypothetical protein